jgi:hypothetical protein
VQRLFRGLKRYYPREKATASKKRLAVSHSAKKRGRSQTSSMTHFVFEIKQREPAYSLSVDNGCRGWQDGARPAFSEIQEWKAPGIQSGPSQPLVER